MIKLPFKRSEDEEMQVNKKIAMKGGSYSLALTAIVLGILIAVNMFVSALPATMTKLDISSSKLYSITSNTKVVVNALDQDVTIYWVVQSGKEDEVIDNLLAKYESLSDHIKVEKKNPDVYPAFTEEYTDEDVSNNSLIVECGDKNRYISYDSIYKQDVDYETYSYVYSFDGEGALTSAISYVSSEDLPKLYVLEGHGEADLPDELTDQITKANMEQESLSLVKENAVPDDADCILIYAPSSDISTEEEEMLADYLSGGGKIMVIAGPAQDDSLDNLHALVSGYGVTAADGIVMEGDSDYYAFDSAYILMPDIQSSDITDPLTESNYYVLMPIAQGFTVNSTGSNGTVTELLTTSDEAYSKKDGYDITTYDKEDGDEDGPFALAFTVEDNSGGELIWLGSSNLLDETYNAYSSGANLDLVMNGFSALIGENEAMAIRTKSLGYNYLTISSTTSAILKTVMIGVLPLIFVVLGIIEVVERRRRIHEQM